MRGAPSLATYNFPGSRRQMHRVVLPVLWSINFYSIGCPVTSIRTPHSDSLEIVIIVSEIKTFEPERKFWWSWLLGILGGVCHVGVTRRRSLIEPVISCKRFNSLLAVDSDRFRFFVSFQLPPVSRNLQIHVLTFFEQFQNRCFKVFPIHIQASHQTQSTMNYSVTTLSLLLLAMFSAANAASCSVCKNSNL